MPFLSFSVYGCKAARDHPQTEMIIDKGDYIFIITTNRSKLQTKTQQQLQDILDVILFSSVLCLMVAVVYQTDTQKFSQIQP